MTTDTTPCTVFQWIGQPLYSCDRCGEPYWTHESEVDIDGVRSPFRAEVPIRRIPEDRAASVRARWEPEMQRRGYVPPSQTEADQTSCACDNPDVAGLGCPVHVSCDELCGAFQEPRSMEELQAAVEHWRRHSWLHGCSHGR